MPAVVRRITLEAILIALLVFVLIYDTSRLVFGKELSPSAPSITISTIYDKHYSESGKNREYETARQAVETKLIKFGYNVNFRVHIKLMDVDYGKENVTEIMHDFMKQEITQMNCKIFIVHAELFANAIGMILNDYKVIKFITALTSLEHLNNNVIVTSDGSKAIYSIETLIYQQAWIAGYLCGITTKTNKLGVVAFDSKDKYGTVSYINAFAMGARYVNSRVEVNIVKINDSDDSPLLQERRAAEILANYHHSDCNIGGTTRGSYVMWDSIQNMTVYSIGIAHDRYIGSDKTLFGIYFDFESHYTSAILDYLNYTAALIPLNSTKSWTKSPDANTNHDDDDVDTNTIKIIDYSPLVTPSKRRRIEDEYNALVVNKTKRLFCGRIPYILPTYVSNDTITQQQNECLNRTQIKELNRWFSPEIIRSVQNITYAESIKLSIVERNGELSISMQMFAAGGMLVSSVFALIVFIHRTKKKVKSRSYKFLIIICIGCMLMYSCVFMTHGTPSYEKCITMSWLFCIGYVIASGSVLAKNFRIWRIFNIKNLKVYPITDLELLGYVGGMTMIMIILLIIWAVTTPYTPVVGKFSEGLEVHVFDIMCYSEPVMPWIILVYCFLLLLASFVIAYNVRTAFSDVNESRQLVLASTFNGFISFIMVVTYFIIPYQVSRHALIFNIVQMVIPTLIMGTLVYPIGHYLIRGTIDLSSTESHGSSSNGGGGGGGGGSHRHHSGSVHMASSVSTNKITSSRRRSTSNVCDSKLGGSANSNSSSYDDSDESIKVTNLGSTKKQKTKKEEEEECAGSVDLPNSKPLAHASSFDSVARSKKKRDSIKPKNAITESGVITVTTE